MRNKHFFFTVTLLLCFTATCMANEFIYGIPEVQSQVVADGEIDEREWIFSAQFPALHRVENWGESDSSIKLRMQYDSENIYLAFQITRSNGFESPQIVPPDELLNFTEDKVRFIFQDTNGSRQELVGNAASELKKVDGSQSGYIYKTKITSTGWQGELQIPYNLESEGEIWFNFINEQETPVISYSSLAYREKENENLWKIIPRNNNLVVSFSPAKSEQIDRSSLWYKIINNHEATSAFTASFKVAFQEGTIGGRISDSWQIAAGKEERLQENQVLKYSCRENDFEVGKTTGRYIVSYIFRDSDDAIIAKGLLFFKNQFPISFGLTPYYLTRNILEIDTVLKERAPADANLEIIAYEAGKPDQVIAEKQVAVRERLSWVEELDTTNCRENTAYHLNLRLLNGTALLAEETIVFNRPANPEWHNNIFGKKEFIPKPFTPLIYEDGTVDVWGRTINLGNNLLPLQIISQEQELLHSPIELLLEINGISVSFDNLTKEIVDQSKEGITLRHRLEDPSFSFKVELRAEYDGYFWYDITIEPKASITINKAALKIPLLAEQATLYNIYGQGPGTIPPNHRLAGYEYSIAGAITDSMEFPFYPYIWLGNEARGIQFFAESDQHWKVANKEQIYLIENKDSYKDFSIQLVNQNKEVDSTIAYGFGLMASPVRPIGQREEFWSATTVPWEGYGDNPTHFKADESLEDFRQRVVIPWVSEPQSQSHFTASRFADSDVTLGDIYGWSPMFGAPYTEDDLFNEKFTLMVQETKKAVPGMKLAPYAGWGINKGYSFWDDFGTEMTRRPWDGSGWNTMLHCANSSFTDFFAYGVDYMLRYYGLDGVYLDSTGSVTKCNRTGHGCGYVDEEGILHGTYPIRATRDLFKRMYKITHCGDYSDELVYLHSGAMFLPIISFADVILTGEVGAGIWQSLKSIDLAEYRAQFLSESYGPPVLLCWHSYLDYVKISTNQIAGFALVHGQTVRMEPRALLTYSSGHQDPGYEADKNPTRHIYLLMNNFSEGKDTDFYPYWDNQVYLSISNPDILGSFYINSKGEALLMLCNLSELDTTINITFNKPNGGISKIEDHFLNTGIPVNGNTFSVDLYGQGYRILWVK